MAYVFDAIDISIFDFHLMIDPLTNPGSVNSNYAFLVDPAVYSQRYQSGTAVKSAAFTLTPLRWRSLNYHHYWKYYQTIWPLNGSYDFWKLQMPLIGEIKQVELGLNTRSPNFTGEVDSNIFVTGMGWSTNLDISLRGPMTPTDVSQFIARLSNKGASMFLVNGTPRILPEVFEYLGDLTHKELYPLHVVPILRLKRFIVMTIASFNGTLAPYQATARRIPAADRALFHSMLGGETVSFTEVIDRESGVSKNPFLLTQFQSRPDFAITYFDYGTLLFMQQTAQNAFKEGRARSKMRCHSQNIRNYLLTTLGLYYFRRDSKNTAALNAKVSTMRTDALTTLQEIPKKYNNAFCQSFHYNYKPLLK